MNRLQLTIASLTTLVVTASIQAQDSALDKDLFDLSIEELMQVKIDVGSRSDRRALSNSPVPVDLVYAKQLQDTGATDLASALLHILPYFNHQYFAIRDGSDHTLPFSMRGMSSDQVLVLVNGKRFHPGALTHLSTALGRGSNSVDLSHFPLSAIDRVEILKNGAAAQYGSDAIAGIFNIILKKQTSSSAGLHLGQTSAGDGEWVRLFGQTSFDFAGKGFATMSLELIEQNKTVRAGADQRQQYFDGDPRNQLPDTTNQVRMDSGNPDKRDLLFNINAQREFDQLQAYANFNFNDRKSSSSGFNRRALDNRTLRAYYPDGYLPRIEPEIQDSSFTLGIQNTADNDWSWDLSNTYGANRFHYYVTNSVNVSMGLDSPTEFDAGELRFSQNTTNFDLTRDFSNSWNMPLTLALGAEYRYETYQIIAGETASYIHGGVPVLDGPNQGARTAAGAQVFPGFQPSNERDVQHNSYALYADAELSPSKDWLLQLAGRYEQHEDFGSTTNYKLATSFNLNEDWLIRASSSTGFRAPSLAQQNFTATSISFINDELVNVGTFGVNDSISRALGAQDLKPEKSTHASLGMQFRPNTNWLLSLDLFYVDIKDRIELSGNISQNVSQFGQEVVDILRSFDVSGARFFTNAIDTRTKGADAAISYDYKIAQQQKMRLSLAYHYNDTNLVGPIKTPNLFENNANVILDRNQTNRITERSPHNNFFATLNYRHENIDVTVKALRYGSVNSIFTTSNPDHDQRLSAKWITDLNINYQWTNRWKLQFGIQNLFDVYPDYSGQNLDSVFFGKDRIFQYSDSSPFGSDGRVVYLGASHQF